MDEKDKKLILPMQFRLKFAIFGMQRSGTTIFANLLLNKLRLPYLHEPSNPRYGLTANSLKLFRADLKNKIDPLERNLLWIHSHRSKLLHRPSYIGRYLKYARSQPYFFKCPFWHTLQATCDLKIERYFVYKEKDEFIKSNLSRNFVFKDFLSQYPVSARFKEISHVEDDRDRVAAFYDLSLATVLKDSGLRLVKIAEVPSVVESIVAKHQSSLTRKVSKPIVFLNGYGRGMMKTGKKFIDQS